MSRVPSSRRSAGSSLGGPQHESSMVGVLLVDDHEGVRAGLKALLECTGRVHVVGEASSGGEAVEKARILDPDIVIMDLAMPGMDGLEATRRITGSGLEAKVLVLTVHDEGRVLLPAIGAGASGLLDKSVADTDLMGALEALVRGQTYLSRRAAALLARRKARGALNREPDPPAEAGTPAGRGRSGCRRTWALGVGAHRSVGPAPSPKVSFRRQPLRRARLPASTSPQHC